MKCERVKIIVLSSIGDLPKAASDHISSCQDCQAMYNDWKILKDVKPEDEMAPPPSLDFLILREADRVSRDKKVITTSFYRWLAVASAAACVIIVALFGK